MEMACVQWWTLVSIVLKVLGLLLVGWLIFFHGLDLVV
jgi:hypothetical protein